MKRPIALLLCAVLTLVPLTSCSQQVTSDKGDRISVVTTIFAPYDFVRAIAGDNVELTMLLPPGAESHSFEPTPQDIIRIQQCDVFIYVGGESDEWVNGILDSMDTSNMRITTLMDCVDVVEEVIVEGMQDDSVEATTDNDHKSPADTEPEYDEHVWTSPRNAMLIVQKISEALCEADPANAETYRANTTDYLARLAELDARFQDVVDHAHRHTIVFGDRFPFRYLADAYGLTYYAAFPGCSAETEASAATIAFLIDKVEAEGLPVVFHIELSNPTIANTISEATGAEVLLLHACHNVSQQDFDAGKTYLDFYNDNVAALKEALQ